ncbi:putative Coenzyme PQQ synthesis protein D (PqqD) [Gammaproteobacteria bacterium]
MSLIFDSIVRRNDELLSAQVDDDLVMMNIATGNYHSLDDIGARVWDILAEPVSVMAICEQLMKEYEVEPTTCQHDVLTLLANMAEQNMLLFPEGALAK